MAITKLDVLDGLESLEICTGYRCGDQLLTEMPGDTAQLASCAPVYETMPGWTGKTQGVTRYEELPAEAKRYVGRLEEVCGVPAAIISTGSDRHHTIIRDGSMTSGWV